MGLMETFWRDYFDLPWTTQEYHRMSYRLQASVATSRIRIQTNLPNSISSKSVTLKNVAVEDQLYNATQGDHIQALVPGISRPAVDGETSIACSKYGEGTLAYIGDVNGEEGSCQVILAIAGIDSRDRPDPRKACAWLDCSIESSEPLHVCSKCRTVYYHNAECQRS